MASYDTCSAVCRFRILDGIAPHLAVWNFRSYMPGLIGGMYFVTGFTASTFPGLMDMQIMKVLVTISEIRQSGGEFIKSDIFIMALKA